jgi:metal-responsive CopG/Arc/MetJ family transcriptional regulator
MKTAVSIPDPVFKAADKLAHRLGMSRSGLYAEALQRYLQLHDEHAITSKLNEVLAHAPSELHPRLQSIQSRSIPRESWK